LSDVKPPLKIRTTADSFAKLVAATKPDFSWGDCYLMWVHDGNTDHPGFELSRAWLLQKPAEKPQCILLETDKDLRLTLYNQLGDDARGLFIPTTIRLGQPKEDFGDGDLAGNYTRVLASDKDHGTVYEIGWQGEMNGGTGHPILEMMLYVCKDTTGKWHFVGEGPSLLGSRGGNASQTAQIVWNKSSPAGTSILFTAENTEYDPFANEPEHDPLPDRDEYQDAVLDGTSPETHYAAHPYLLAKTGDTLDSLVHLLSIWSFEWGAGNAAERAKVEQNYRSELFRLNPDLSKDKITPGTKVFILSYAQEIDEAHDESTSTKP